MREVLVLLVMGVVGGKGTRSSAGREGSLRYADLFAFVGHARRLPGRVLEPCFEPMGKCEQSRRFNPSNKGDRRGQHE